MLKHASLAHQRRSKVLLIFLASMLVIGFNVYEANAESTEQRSLADIRSFADILAIALANDGSVKLSDIQVEEAISGVQRIEVALRPQFVVSGDYRLENIANNSMGRQFATIEQEMNGEAIQIRLMNLDDQVRTSSGSFTIVQQLGTNTQLRTALQKADIGEELSVLQHEKAVAQLALKVQSNYHNMRKAYHGVELARLALNSAKRDLEIVEHKQSIGAATMLDILQERNALLEADNRLSSAEAGLNVAVLGILQAIGLDRSYLTNFHEFVEQLMANEKYIPVQWAVDYEAARDYALMNRLEIQMLAIQREMAKIDYQGHLDDRDWKVSLTGRYVADDVVFDGTLDSNRLFRGTVATTSTRWPVDLPGNLGPNGSDTNPWQVGVSVNYSFGPGGNKKHEGNRLRLAIEKADIQYSSAKDGITMEVYANHQQLEQAWRSYKLALQGQEQAEETSKNLESMYKLGSITEKELLAAQLMVAQARNQVEGAALDYAALKSQLASVLGVNSSFLVKTMTSEINWNEIDLR